MARRRILFGTNEALFRSMHRRACDDPRSPPDWDRFDPGALDPVVREELRRAWSARVVAEYRSMAVFSALIGRLPEAGMPVEVTAATARLLQDEARHTELCSRLAEALGGAHDATVAPADTRLTDESLRAELFIARWTLSMMCVGECASVGLLKALSEVAEDPCVRRVLETLLRDEVLHDRLGWALAREIVPRLSDEEREWLGADLSFSFAHYDRIHGRGLRRDGDPLPDDVPRADGAEALGLVSSERYARAWYERLDTVIVPQICALGLPAREAWALRHEAAAAVDPTSIPQG
jgi:hypothetical protein